MEWSFKFDVVGKYSKHRPVLPFWPPKFQPAFLTDWTWPRTCYFLWDPFQIYVRQIKSNLVLMITQPMIKFLRRLTGFNIEKAVKPLLEKHWRSLKVFSSMKMDEKKSWFFLLVSHMRFYYSYLLFIWIMENEYLWFSWNSSFI